MERTIASVSFPPHLVMQRANEVYQIDEASSNSLRKEVSRNRNIYWRFD